MEINNFFNQYCDKNNSNKSTKQKTVLPIMGNNFKQLPVTTSFMYVLGKNSISYIMVYCTQYLLTFVMFRFLFRQFHFLLDLLHISLNLRLENCKYSCFLFSFFLFWHQIL